MDDAKKLLNEISQRHHSCAVGSLCLIERRGDCYGRLEYADHASQQVSLERHTGRRPGRTHDGVASPAIECPLVHRSLRAFQRQWGDRPRTLRSRDYRLPTAFISGEICVNEGLI
jgi:hypothetical protein